MPERVVITDTSFLVALRSCENQEYKVSFIEFKDLS
jgi:hypothetical protein